jgi:methanogenic corrinoid protein MtbC1
MARLTAQGIPARAAADSIADMDDRAVVARLQAPATERSAALRAEQERSAGAGAAGDEGRAAGGSPRSGGAAGAARGGLPAHEHAAPAGATGVATVDVEAVDSIVAAASALDARSLVHLYRAALRRLDFEHAWTDVLAPSLREIGEQWAAGRLGVECEHLASDVLQGELRSIARARRTDATGAPVLLVSADDEQHHLPLLALEAELARLGVPALHLGPRVPAQAVVDSMRRTGARAVFVWASMARVPSEPFWGLLDDVAVSAKIVVGGPGWPDRVEKRLRTAEVCRVDDLSSAVTALLPQGE